MRIPIMIGLGARSFLLAVALWSCTVAGSTVDVALQASFPSPPLLVELLETAATENSNAFLPLLDKIAAGIFYGRMSDEGIHDILSDEEVYNRFLKTLERDKFLHDAATISSWKLALSVHEAAPRIQAQYQFWNSSVRYLEEQSAGEAEGSFLSIFKPNGQACLDDSCAIPQRLNSLTARDHRDARSFDRLVGSGSSAEVWTLYIDPADPQAMNSYKNWRLYFPHASFRLRYRMPRTRYEPLAVSGYGVELALKRTDYIVIDDRDAEKQQTTGSLVDLVGDSEDKDVRPLSASELRDLGLKTSSFILNDPNPIETLARLSQDFPKHASTLAAQDVSQTFLTEHLGNRELMLPAGYNMMWMNGLQVSPRDVNIFSLLEQLRRERRLINGLHTLGLSHSDANRLLSHPAIADTQGDGEPQRYDFRDEADGGRIILWLNNIEKDKRYAEWPSELKALLQRTFPGQLPAVRRDIHNLVFPVDFADAKSTAFITETLLNLVQRMVPVRFGLVPVFKSSGSVDQAKIIYHLQETYGLAAVVEYLESSTSSGSLTSPSQKHFDEVTSTRQLRRSQSPKTMSEIFSSEDGEGQISNGRGYLRRLSVDGTNPPFFANGVPVVFDEDWLQGLSQRVSLDLRKVQQQVYAEIIDARGWLPEKLFLKEASYVRNPVIVPENEKSVALFDMSKIHLEHAFELDGLRSLHAGNSNRPSLIVFMDLMSNAGRELFVNAVDFSLNHPDVYVALNHFSENRSPLWSDMAMDHLRSQVPDLTEDVLKRIEAALMKEPVPQGKRTSASSSPLASGIGLKHGEQGVLINGRLVGPLPASTTITAQDFETLVAYETKKRVQPALDALEALELSDLLELTHDLAKVTSIIALSSKSDVPEGIFDSTPGPRTAIFEKWQSEHTSFHIGHETDAQINFVVSLDPVSEVAQQWVPILKVLCQLNGVHAQIFLNPQQKIQELPVKRFFRQVLTSAPMFYDVGSLESPKAQFAGIPEDTLLTLAMDTPPSWLVAPKQSIYDLDNIKLSSLKAGENVNATYELEHILIEGHSREPDSGSPPRGAQLVLGTDAQPDLTGTIVMANLGYFQFKANPGVYDLALQKGKSDTIYQIDSAGTLGHTAQAGDEMTEIALASFQGATIFPRLSRKPGRETEDVLDMPELPIQEAVTNARRQAQSVLAKGGKLADDILAKAGISDVKTGELAAQAVAYGQGLLSKAMSSLQKTTGRDLSPLPSSKHADINIFSVASGHLYERMLNIMMLSVMKHTKHTVKFWFIEQFLSPSFKTFLPTLAAEYGFEYEMVTYKWPHWLRAQKEKQRVIWGYKILFLDVLFPLDLDKVIFVDADQIVRTDMYELVTHDLEGAPYGFTPMCDSRTEMEGFRFWKQGYWKNFLRGLPYHISALYVVDLKMFRAMAAGDRLRGQYQSLSADPNSLSNLDQDLPNHMQMNLPIHSLPQEWLWCETWCDDESLKTARTIDLCNNPQTKEPKLDRARRQVPEWTVYDNEVAALARRKKAEGEYEAAAAGIVVEGAEESGASDPRPVKDEL